MKRFIFILSILLIAPTIAFAQNPDNQCNPIDAGNFNNCCTSPTDTPTSNRCYAYLNSPQYCIDFPQDDMCKQIPGQIGGQGGTATPSTNPVNSGSTSGNDDGGFSPQSGTAELASCSAMKIKSVLDILIWLKCIIVAAIIPLIFALAFLFFLWGVLKFMMATDVKAKQEGQKLIWWGIIGLFVMVSVWGIIKILGQTFGIESTVPTLQTTYLKK